MERAEHSNNRRGGDRDRKGERDRTREGREYGSDRRHDDRRADRHRSRSRSPKRRRSRSRSHDRNQRDRGNYRGGRRDRRGGDRRHQDHRQDDPNREPVLNAVPSSVAPQAVARIQAQLAKRRALWQNKPQEKAEAAPAASEEPSGSLTTAAVWKAAAFKEDQDGKVSSKFKRLMGMKGAEESGAVPESEEVLKKQAELFSKLDMQYEQARAATHTAKGMGLGFGSLGGVPR